MDNNSFYSLKVNPELKKLVPPLSAQERELMIASLCDSEQPPEIRVWFNTILVDYECYEYCITLNIPFNIAPVNLQCFEEAIIWVCKNQINREDISEPMKKYLIGKRCLTESTLGAHEAVRLKQRKVKNIKDTMRVSKYEASISEIRKQLGAEYYMSMSTIRKYEQYSLMIDKIAFMYPKFISDHLAGKLKLSLQYLEQLALLPDDQFKRCVKSLVEGKPEPIALMPLRSPVPAQNTPAPAVETTIKDMPVYDPDAEISSLTLTVPSWISSIKRVINMADLKAATLDAMNKLRAALLDLKLVSDDMLYLMRRENDERKQ